MYIVLVSGVYAPEGHTDIGINLGTCAVKAHPVMQIEFLILFFGSQHHDTGSSAANLGDRLPLLPASSVTEKPLLIS